MRIAPQIMFFNAFGTFLQTCAQWSDYLERIVIDVGARIPSLGLVSVAEPVSCAESWALRKFREFLHFTVSDWLTVAPSRVPDIGTESSVHGLQAEVTTFDALSFAEHKLAAKGGCFEAQMALDLFSLVLYGGQLSIKFPELYGSTWAQVTLSQWPILGLAAQVLRLTAKPFIKVSRDECDAFLELVPIHPVDAHALVIDAIYFLEKPPQNHASCLLATSLALAVLLQRTPEGSPSAHTFEAVSTALTLLAAAGDVHNAPQAAVFYLLDRAVACASRVLVKSPAGRQFPVYVFPFRDHISDQIRFFGDTHCGFYARRGIDLESVVAEMVTVRRGPIFVVEVGAGLGTCILPLLFEPQVSALAIEVSRQVRHLMARSFELNRVQDKVEIVPAYIDLPGPLQSREPDALVDLLFHRVGHFTIGSRSPDLQGNISLPPVLERSPAFVKTLPEVLGRKHVDLLLISPTEICDAVGKQIASVHCRQHLGEHPIEEGMCAFEDCRVEEGGIG